MSLADLLGSKPVADEDDDGDASMASPKSQGSGGSGESGSEDERGVDLMGDNTGDEDSSEEEDDDSEEERRVRKDFIVDEDDTSGKKRRRKKKKRRKDKAAAEDGDGAGDSSRKRRKDSDEEGSGLDEDDLELLEENTGVRLTNRGGKKLKRLRRRKSVSEGSDASSRSRDGSLTNIFDDEERGRDGAAEGLPFDADEMAGFIEDDETQSERGAGSDSDDGDDARRRKRREKQKAKESRGRAKGGRRAGFGAGFVEGITAEAWQEVTDVFGNGQDYAFALDDEEDDEKEAKGLQDIFEPSEIASRMLTVEDDHIRQLDVPERLQLASAGLGQQGLNELGHLAPYIAPDEIDTAAHWMSKRISTERTEQFCVQNTATGDLPELHAEFIEAIKSALTFLNIDFLEVPFIWHHRSDYLVKYGDADKQEDTVAFLAQPDLFRLEDLSIKYRAFLSRKKELRSLIESLGLTGESTDEFLEDYFDNLDSVEDIADLNDWVSMRYVDRIQAAKRDKLRDDLVRRELADGANEEEEQAAIARAEQQLQARKKRATRESAYEVAKKSMISRLAEACGLPAHELSRVMMSGSKTTEHEDPDAMPLEHADGFGGTIEYPSATSAMNAAKMICIHEISRDPYIKQEARRLFERYAVVSVKPTEKGVQKIDEMNPFYVFKYLLNKPYHLFKRSAQFLQIVTAEREGLVESSITLPQPAIDNFITTLSRAYLSDLTSSTAEAWNALRLEILQAAVREHLLPHGEVWAKNKLQEEEEELVGKQCASRLRHRIDVAPYRRSDETMDKGDIPTVLALSNGMGDPKRDDVVAVYLDQDGHFREHVKVSNMFEPSETEREQLTELLKRRRPQVCVVGGFSPNARRLLEDFLTFARGVSEELVRDEVDQVDEDAEDKRLTAEQLTARATFETVFVFDDVARIYSNSQRASLEFPDLGKLGKYCVGLARYAQSPLNEYAALGSDLSALTYDQNQKFVAREKIHAHLERALIDVVNKTGVDINRAMRNPYYAHLLSYVCGLGPRKADLLVKKINSQYGGTLPSRFSLLSKQILTAKVGENAAAFLRIPQDALHADLGRDVSDDDQPEILDDTRIHPENYDIARKMAADAMEIDEEDEQGQEVKSHAVQALMDDDVNRLDELSLDDFANELMNHIQRRKRLALYGIRDELKNPYAEQREAFFTPNSNEIFTMLSGETRATLEQGHIIPVRVVRLRADDGIAVRLDSGLEGIIPAHGQDDPTERRSKPQPGSTIPARVIELRPEVFEIELSTQAHVLSGGDRDYRQVRPDPSYWDRDEAAAEQAARSAIERKTVGRQMRLIKHPNFHNVDSGGAEELLTHMQRGDCIIRPSSKEDHLAVTWKVADGVYQHLAVMELDKQNELTLGSRLRIHDRVYSDLDELIVAHIKQMAIKVGEMVNHDKFKGTQEQLKTWLSQAAQGDPNRAFYGFCFDPDRRKAGQFMIGFRANLKAETQYWPVKLMPGAFVLNGEEHDNMMKLCNAFKTSYASRASANAARIPVGTRTPMHPGLLAGSRTPGGNVGGRTPGGGVYVPGRGTPLAAAAGMGSRTPNPYAPGGSGRTPNPYAPGGSGRTPNPSYATGASGRTPNPYATAAATGSGTPMYGQGAMPPYGQPQGYGQNNGGGSGGGPPAWQQQQQQQQQQQSGYGGR